MNLKKQGIAFYLNVLAVILSAVGLGLTIHSSTMTTDNVLLGFTTIVAAGVIGIVLECVAVYLPNRMGNHDPISAISVLASIALLCYVFGQCILQRITMIAGLFSFNSGNTAGWQVFYVTVAAVACLLVAIVLLIVGSFLKSVKE